MKYKKFEIDDLTLVVIIALLGFAMMVIFGCAPVAEIYEGNIGMGLDTYDDTIYIELHNWRGIYQENDTVVGSDTLYYWTR